ncbi:hypothetical protein FRC17_002271 [Serendipita sp. 399]|nr:hypothetical protein FRC17_002271 [Serendipita sp. 399]
MRTLTGSSILSDAAEQPGAYTDRALSPYNLRKHSGRGPSPSALIARHPEGPKSIDLGSIVGGSSTTTPPAAPQHNYVSPALITSSSQTLAPGIPTFVNYVGIPTGNAWMSVFFGMLFLWIGYAGILVFAWLAALALMHSKRTTQIGENLRHELPRIATEGAIRLLQISFLPVLVFTLFQWTLHDNWLSTFISVLAFLTTFCCFGWLAVQVAQPTMVNTKIPSILSQWTEKLKRNRPVNEDGHIATSAELEEQGSIEPESPPSKLSRWFALFIQHMRVTAIPAFIAPYRPSRQAFALLSPLLLTIFKACFIALAKTHGFTQVIVLLIIESSYLLAIIWLKPFYPRFRDEPNPSADDLNTAHNPPSNTLSREVGSSECKSPDSKLTTGKIDSPRREGIDSDDSSIASPQRQRQRRKANFFARRGDFLELFLSVLRIISTAGLLPFVREKLSVEAIPRVVVGIGIAVVCSVGVIVLAMNIVVHLLPWGALWRKGRRNEEDQTGTSPQPDQATEPSKEIP